MSIYPYSTPILPKYLTRVRLLIYCVPAGHAAIQSRGDTVAVLSAGGGADGHDGLPGDVAAARRAAGGGGRPNGDQRACHSWSWHSYVSTPDQLPLFPWMTVFGR